jgi:hypothetical protein
VLNDTQKLDFSKETHVELKKNMTTARLEAMATTDTSSKLSNI